MWPLTQFKDHNDKPINPAIQLIAELNGSLLDFLRPATWMGDGVCPRKASKRIRYAHCRWVLKGAEPGTVARVIRDNAPSKGNFVVVGMSDPLKIHIRFFTPILQWLDVIDIHISPTPCDGGEVQATAHSTSTGLFPACCPCSPCLSVLSFWFPFKDWGKNLLHLRELKNLLKEHGIEVEETVDWSGSKRVPENHGPHTLGPELASMVRS